jgi:hypothetical protein
MKNPACARLLFPEWEKPTCADLPFLHRKSRLAPACRFFIEKAGLRRPAVSL